MEIGREFLKSNRWEEWKKYETDQRKDVPPPPPQKSYPSGATLIDLVAPDDLTIGQMPVIEAINGKEILIEPNSPSEGVMVAFIVEDGAPVELMEINQTDDQHKT